MRKIKYDVEVFNFKKVFENFIGLSPLENLNLEVEVFKRENDQSTQFHKRFYELARTDEFKILYEQFILKNIKPLYDEEYLVYQTIPTFRIAFQNNIAVGEFHKDKTYRDILWAESVREDNFFLPFTEAFDTNTIWVESEEDKGDYKPMNCHYGECIMWDGSNLCHGNKLNITGKTRVSVDFRVMPISRYIPSSKGSINAQVRFEVGGYYSKI